ncbi:hypothetical protein [Mesorhizobium sp. CAU 1732]|uniref:hypothetical protein n=1 Tax=Mesorhizobium sp. CAU 1732 TaxID=3140358 RepID=UPI00326033F7
MVAALFASLWSRVTGYAVAVATVAAILFAAYRKGGKDAAARTAEQRLNQLNKARKVEHEVDRRSDDDVHRDLSKWLRD